MTDNRYAPKDLVHVQCKRGACVIEAALSEAGEPLETRTYRRGGQYGDKFITTAGRAASISVDILAPVEPPQVDLNAPATKGAKIKGRGGDRRSRRFRDGFDRMVHPGDTFDR